MLITSNNFTNDNGTMYSRTKRVLHISPRRSFEQFVVFWKFHFATNFSSINRKLKTFKTELQDNFQIFPNSRKYLAS